MKKLELLLLLGMSVILTACGNTSKKDATITTTEQNTPTTIEATTAIEETTTINYKYFKNTNVPQCEQFFGVSEAFVTIGSWDDGYVVYTFCSKNNEEAVQALVPGYDSCIDINESFSKYDEYLTNNGYAVKKGKDEERDTLYTYTKDNIEVNIAYDSDNLDFTIIDSERYDGSYSIE